MTDVRTLKTLLAILASVLLVVVVALLIIESTAVTDDYYAAHAERMKAIGTSQEDIGNAVASMRNAVEKGESVPRTTESALSRLVENNRILQPFSNVPRRAQEVQSQLVVFDEELYRFVSNGEALIASQNGLAAALTDFQEESPIIVRELRQRGLGSQSKLAFALAIDIIDYATGPQNLAGEDLTARLQQLLADSEIQARLASNFGAFAATASAVIAGRAGALEALERIENGSIAPALSALNYALLVDDRRTVRRAENSRILLAICVVILLVAVGYTILRLQSSYRELNVANASLERTNATLEERVLARTEQLSQAYDELKESQVQLVQAEKMSSLGELVAGISHEINTPLWYLMSNSSVIQERLETMRYFCEIADSMLAAVRSRSGVTKAVQRGLNDMHQLMEAGIREDIEEAHDLVQDSIDGLEDLTELAQSLKDFSRLDRARSGSFDVNEGLDKTLLIVKNKIKYKATVHKHYGHISPIDCSPSQINQIFLNLLTNAVDSFEDQGEIVLHTWEDDGMVSISVSDSGAGIPAELLPKIRDPFFTTKEVGKGTGLGLSIVDQIVTAHGGELNIESVPGKGTNVTVSLPKVAPGPIAIKGLREDTGAGDDDLMSEFPPPGAGEPIQETTNAMTA